MSNIEPDGASCGVGTSSTLRDCACMFFLTLAIRALRSTDSRCFLYLTPAAKPMNAEPIATNAIPAPCFILDQVEDRLVVDVELEEECVDPPQVRLVVGARCRVSEVEA